MDIEKWMIAAVLGFLFPPMMIRAIRTADEKEAKSMGWQAGLVFAAIAALLAM